MSEENKEVEAEAPAAPEKASREPVTIVAQKAATKEWKCPEKVGINSLALPFPTDPIGAMKPLKDGGLKTINRIKGDPTKLEQFKQVLQVLLRHATEKTEYEAEKRAEARKNAVSASARVAERQKRAAQDKVAALQKQIDAVKGNYGLTDEKEAE